MSILRVAFTLQNDTFFKQIDASLFLIGCYFDLITIALFSLPLFILLNPLNDKLGTTAKKSIQVLVKFYMLVLGFTILVLNSWDIAYFSYTQKRSGFSYFLHLLTGTETSSLAGEFLLEFWWLPIVFICLLYLLWRQIKKFDGIQFDLKNKQHWLRYFLLLCFAVVMGRGGVQLRPIGIIDATALSSLEQAPIVLNTAFTVLKTTDDGATKLVKIHSNSSLQSLQPLSRFIATKRFVF